MSWDEILENWKVITGIFTGIFVVVAWFASRKKDTAEVIKAKAEALFKRAETRKINREIDSDEQNEINDLRKQLLDARKQISTLENTIDDLTRKINVLDVYRSYFKK